MKAAMTAALRRALSMVVALLIAFGPTVATAKRPKIDRQVLQVCKRARTMLNQLEYERARALLESSVRKSRNTRARPGTKAKLWALLGRSRAELGDRVGSDEAFLEAVRWDRRVKLSRSASPKIRQALDRARALAPPPRSVEPKPKRPKPDIQPKLVAPRPKPPVKPRPKPTRPKVKNRPRVRNRPRSRPAKTLKSKPTKKGPWVDFRVVGEVRPGATVKIVASYKGVPRRARFEAKVRRSQAGPFETIRLSRTGTLAVGRLVLDSPRLEIFVVARRGRRIVAQAGSESKTFAVAPVSSTPTLAEAWSTPAPPPAAPPPPLPQAQTATVAPAYGSGPPPPGVVPPAPPPAQEAGQLNGTEIAILAAGGAVVVTAVVVAVLLLAPRTPKCDAVENQGCVEVQVVPSSLLRF